MPGATGREGADVERCCSTGTEFVMQGEKALEILCEIMCIYLTVLYCTLKTEEGGLQILFFFYIFKHMHI